MGTSDRRSRRQARRRIGELVEATFYLLDILADEAHDQLDDQAGADCNEAVARIEDSLTPDGHPTGATAAVLIDVLTGPVTHAIHRLDPHIELPPELLQMIAANA
jgi:hypothetical protein